MKSFRKQSDKLVRKLAKDSGAKVVSNSGATAWAKGDITTDTHLIEHKFTLKDSFKVDSKDLHKVWNEAMRVGKEPIFMIEFKDVKFIGYIEK